MTRHFPEDRARSLIPEGLALLIVLVASGCCFLNCPEVCLCNSLLKDLVVKPSDPFLNEDDKTILRDWRLKNIIQRINQETWAWLYRTRVHQDSLIV